MSKHTWREIKTPTDEPKIHYVLYFFDIWEEEQEGETITFRINYKGCYWKGGIATLAEAKRIAEEGLDNE